MPSERNDGGNKKAKNWWWFFLTFNGTETERLMKNHRGFISINEKKEIISRKRLGFGDWKLLWKMKDLLRISFAMEDFFKGNLLLCKGLFDWRNNLQ